jgi:hypothetical protein
MPPGQSGEEVRDKPVKRWRERHDWPGLQSVIMVESVREIGED